MKKLISPLLQQGIFKGKKITLISYSDSYILAYQKGSLLHKGF